LQQNGHAERVLRTLNDCVRTLLFHAHVPTTFWPDALAIATLLVNLCTCRTRWNYTPHHLLFGSPPTYNGLRIFRCRCCPSTVATAPHKLAPRSIPFVFLGYPANTKGYRCYDPVSHRVVTSRHIYFDEHYFPFAQEQVTPSSSPAGDPSPRRVLAPAAVPRPAPVTPSSPSSGAPSPPSSVVSGGTASPSSSDSSAAPASSSSSTSPSSGAQHASDSAPSSGRCWPHHSRSGGHLSPIHSVPHGRVRLHGLDLRALAAARLCHGSASRPLVARSYAGGV
jgi:hypothetical protein